MARKALIVGVSGTGKSTSIETLDPKKTFIINVNNKALPFKGYKSKYSVFNKDNINGNYVVTDNPSVILKTLQYVNDKMPHIDSVVLDDFTYMLTNEYMRRAKEKGYEMFKDIGQNTFTILKAIDDMRDDLNVFVIGHPEVDVDGLGNKTIKLKTLGKHLPKLS